MQRSLIYSLSWSLLAVSTVTLGIPACAPEERNFGDSSSSSSGSGGSGGSEGACTPDKTEACYSGPKETLEVGLCKGGTHVCLPSGMGFGECGGEVVPAVEDCLTPEDEACNGDNPKECPALADGWLKTFGSVDFGQSVQDIAITATGEIVVVGAFADTIDFGVGPMASTGLSDIFVAKFDRLGNAIWSRRFGDAATQIAYAVGVDSMGAIYVGGSMYGKVDFDGTILTSAGVDDAFLARFESDGKLSWAQSWGDVNAQSIRNIKVTKTNLVVVAGEFKGTLPFDAGQNNLTSAGGSDVFVARFDASGFIAGSRVFGGTLNDTVRGLTLDNANQIYLTGGFEGMANFGGPTLTSTGGRDAYAVQLTPTLGTITSLSFGNPNGPNSYQEGYDVVVNANDEVFVSGGFTEGITFPGNTLSTPDPTSRSIYIAHFDSGLGSLSSVKGYGGSLSGLVSEARLAIDPGAKHLVVAGAFTGDIDFGGGILHADAAADPYFAKFAFDGTFVAARALPNEAIASDNANVLNALALLPLGDLIIGGVQRTPIVYGQQVVGAVDLKDGNALLGRFLH